MPLKTSSGDLAIPAVEDAPIGKQVGCAGFAVEAMNDDVHDAIDFRVAMLRQPYDRPRPRKMEDVLGQGLGHHPVERFGPGIELPERDLRRSRTRDDLQTVEIGWQPDRLHADRVRFIGRAGRSAGARSGFRV